MVVSLYTSRVVLQTLGINDFGIYNVVAGFVTMLGFLHGAMSSATQRFLAFELGKPGDKDVRGIFSMSLNIHILIALLVFVLGETIGLWFIQTQLAIPSDRIIAAESVFHLALLSYMLTIINVPYNALIIAHERMSIFAWISIIDVTLKLLIVFMLGWFSIDKLILYGILNLGIVFIVFIIYRSYCKKYFRESKFRIYWDKQLFKIMLSYTGWNLWGNIASVLSGQGVNVLLNIFFGPSVNAARAIAMQVSGALNGFVQNLQVAINPQIIKSYAAKEMHYMYHLVCYGAKYNFLLLFFLSMPVLINTDEILILWLGSTPEYISIFIRLIIIDSLINCISSPLMTSAQATGKIKLYQSIVGAVLLLNLPFAYLILKIGGEPHTVIYVSIVISICTFLARLIILKKLISLPISRYLKEVVGRGLLIISTVLILYFSLIYFLGKLDFMWSLITICICVFCSIAFFGFDKNERKFIFNKIKNKINFNSKNQLSPRN